MARLCCRKVLDIDVKRRRCALAVCWFSGLLCGIFVFLRAGAPVTSLMRRMLYGSVSIVSLISICFIPFLFTAFAVFISELRLLFPICFCKALLFAFVSIGICAAFGSAGWLLRTLLLFCDGICVLFLYILWVRLLSGQEFKCFAGTIGFSVVCILAGITDYYVISPFLARLIEI